MTAWWGRKHMSPVSKSSVYNLSKSRLCDCVSYSSDTTKQSPDTVPLWMTFVPRRIHSAASNKRLKTKSSLKKNKDVNDFTQVEVWVLGSSREVCLTSQWHQLSCDNLGFSFFKVTEWLLSVSHPHTVTFRDREMGIFLTFTFLRARNTFPEVTDFIHWSELGNVSIS